MLGSNLRKLNKKLTSAETYSEWKGIASEIESASGLDRWKMHDYSPHYDYQEIRFRLDKLRRLRKRNDYSGLLFALNEGIHGNIGGMGHPVLYKRPMYGTKQLIEAFIEEVAQALIFLSENKIKDINKAQLKEFFERASHCFGSSAFMMSGGGMLLYFHIGVVRCLLKNGLLPDIISGSSGGAYVAAILGTYKEEDLLNILTVENISTIINSQKSSKKKSFPILRSSALSVEEVINVINSVIPDLTFAEAYKLTGKQINIPVAPAVNHQTSHLLNATTTPNVCIREAVRASAAVPGKYPAINLSAKDDNGDRKIYMPSRKWVDGSISDDIPAKKMARLYGVNHYIVSQTNPHLLPFISESQKDLETMSILKNASIKSTKVWLNAFATLFHNGISKSQTLNMATNRLLSMTNQDYIGDINILPPFKFPPPVKLLTHPTEDDMQKLIEMGERATWPKIEMIAIQTRISRTLKNILEKY